MLQLPSTQEQWLHIAKRFEDQWNFPHCLGAIDGKHCILQSPIHSGSEFYNYKSTFSILLMGIGDADYCFVYADVGCQGRISDGGVFKNTSFYKKLDNNEIEIPNEESLPGRASKIPYVFVADDAFPLKNNIMKPFPGIQKKGSKERIFNYRLSRARRIIENIFGIMSAVFRVLRKPMLIEPHTQKATKVVLCCVYLHNFLRKSHSSRNIYTPLGIFDAEVEGHVIEGSWRNDSNPSSFLPLNRVGRKPSQSSHFIRQEFADYFKTNVGSVPWQDEYA